MPDRKPLDLLQDALAELAAEDAPGLMAEARVGARTKARGLIEDALVDELLRAAGRARPPGQRAHEPEPRLERQPGPAGEPEPEPGRERDTAAAMSGDAWWTYCVLDANQADSVPADLSGVEPGTTIEIIRDGKFAALISRVPLAEYEDDRLREHMN